MRCVDAPPGVRLSGQPATRGRGDLGTGNCRRRAATCARASGGGRAERVVGDIALRGGIRGHLLVQEVGAQLAHRLQVVIAPALFYRILRSLDEESTKAACGYTSSIAARFSFRSVPSETADCHSRRCRSDLSLSTPFPVRLPRNRLPSQVDSQIPLVSSTKSQANPVNWTDWTG